MNGRLTRFTTERPKTLGKTFTLSSTGVLLKETAGQISTGRFKVEQFATVAELVALLQSVKTSEAISASLPAPGSDCGAVVAEKLLASHPGAITRSKKHFSLPDSPGLLTLDYDPPDAVTLTREELWAAVLRIAPALTDAGVVHWYSGSSFIFNGDTCLKPASGQRLYVMVASLADVPRTLAALNKRAWLADLGGHIKVSSSGAHLVRSLFDSAMGDAGARADFIGGAVVTPPLEQRRGAPTILAGDGFVDTRAAVPDLTEEEESAYTALVEAAKHRAQPEAEAQRQRWRDDHTRQAVAKAVSEGTDIEQARALVGRTLDAALGRVLLGGFGLIYVDDKGTEYGVTVDQVLADRPRYHLGRFLSPLNPNHRDRSPDAILYADQPFPVIYDLDEGGVAYRLYPQPVRLQVASGGRADLASQIADRLAESPDLFSIGGSLTLVESGKFASLTRPLLSWLIGTRVSLYRQGRDKQTATDLDQQTADMVKDLLLLKAKMITGTASTPLIDVAGRVIERPGLDDATGIYLNLVPGEWGAVPTQPTHDETVTALRRLWKPWSAYQWATPSDRAAMLAAVLTVPMRPCIDVAPGLLADAPLPSSGKSKATGAVAALIEGRKVAPKPWVSGNEAEVEKFVLSLARSGGGTVVLDNIVGTLDSPCMASVMTDGRVSGRLLGTNNNVSPEARLLWLASGNNASLSRELATRWLRARIDTGSGSPHKLAYAFDPVEVALADRKGIIRAALILHRAWHSAARPTVEGARTRFADWDLTVRQLVQWLDTSGIATEAGIGTLDDCAASILDGASVSDPEQEALNQLLFGLSETFGDASFGTGEVAQVFKQGENSTNDGHCAIFEGVVGLLPRARLGISSQALGSVLRQRRDRPVCGLKLVEVKQHGRAATRGSAWQVVECQH